LAENINLTLENLRAAIEDFTEQSGQCCTSKGQDIESPPSDGQVSVGDDEQFPDQSSYFGAKCNAANAIYDQTKGTIDWLRNNNVDFLAGALGGLTTALTMAVIISGPVGWTLEIAAVTIISLSTYLINHALDFEDLQNAFIDVHAELVTALFNASDTNTAKDSFIAALDASTVPTTVVEQGIVRLLLPADLLNLLFSPRDDVAVYQSPSPVDCGTSVLASWTFPVDAEGWTFRDDSVSPSSASGAYNSPGQSLEISKTAAGGGSRPITKGTWLKTGLSVVVPAGSAVQFDYTGTSDGIAQGGDIFVEYSDMTTTSRTLTLGHLAGTMVMSLPAAKTISEIEISTWRITSSSNTHTSDIEEVRVLGT